MNGSNNELLRRRHVPLNASGEATNNRDVATAIYPALSAPSKPLNSVAGDNKKAMMMKMDGEGAGGSASASRLSSSRNRLQNAEKIESSIAQVRVTDSIS